MTWSDLKKTSSGWQVWSPTIASGFPLQNCKPLIAGDVNGDGKTDLICPFDYGNGSTQTIVQLNQGNGFSGWHGWSPTIASGFPLQNCKPLIAGDLNGDGKTDLICPFDYGGGSTQTIVQISQGNTFSGWQGWSPTLASGFPLQNCKPLIAGDLNGDGKTDLICPFDYGGGSTQTIVQISQGNTFSGWQGWSPTLASGFPLQNCKSLTAGDVNGDGKTDLICPFDYGNGSTQTIAQLLVDGAAGLVNSVKSGFGADTSIAYKPITDNGTHTKDHSAAYPYL